MATSWSCGCKVRGFNGHLRSYCRQHEDWSCHGGSTDPMQPINQPNLGSCPICFYVARAQFTRSQ